VAVGAVWHGWQVSEVLLFDAVLSADQTQQLQHHLLQKHALLPAAPSDNMPAGALLHLSAAHYASQGLANRDRVTSAWTDTSPTAVDAVGPSGPGRVLYQTQGLNGRPTLLFSEAAYFRTSVNSPVFVVGPGCHDLLPTVQHAYTACCSGRVLRARRVS